MERNASRNRQMLLSLGLGGFLVNADNRAIAPMLPAMAVSLHTSMSSVALLVTAYSIPYGVFQLVYGPIAEKIGKVSTIFMALCLFSLGTLLCGVAHVFSWLLVLRVLTGLFAAGIIPTTLAQIGDRFDLSERPGAIALFMSFSTSGQALGIVIGGLVAQFFSYRILFFLLGLACIPALLAIFRERGRETIPVKPNPTPILKRYIELFKHKRSWQIYGLVLCEGLVFYGGFTFLGVYGVSTLHLSYLIIGLLTATYSVGAFIGSKTITKVLSRVGTTKMPMLGSGLMILGFGVIWGWQSVISLTVGFIILGFGFSYCHSTLQTFATDLLPNGRATAVSVFAFSLFLGSGLGPIGVGDIFDAYGSRMMLGAVCLGTIVFCFLCMTLLKRNQQTGTN
ncbi:MFS transporter [Pullulanibacillus sp. KACC 23026]|uniref:MFS transporter n=1 Tax=Pullulanibacillus sp. KACC 23026 TaxID=3028315 RepID=UPI0023AE94E6|nr:MFS transporter [Pullulanibacillus sp. KACC 23026]WEG13531.1 MFS transporter [Pullulanibacillus sp. KACC 23026]